MTTDSEIGEVVARARQKSLAVCENCGGEGYTDMGRSACATCFGAGVTTPEMLAALSDRTRLAERLEDKTNALRTEIAAKVGAYPEIKMLEDGIAEIISLCDQDARDQKHNGADTTDKQSKAYAEGRETACRGIATWLRALVET